MLVLWCLMVVIKVFCHKTERGNKTFLTVGGGGWLVGWTKARLDLDCGISDVM